MHANANYHDNKYKQIFRLRALHFLAFFIFVYVGVEVTIGGAALARSHTHLPFPAFLIF